MKDYFYIGNTCTVTESVRKVTVQERFPVRGRYAVALEEIVWEWMEKLK